MISELVAGSAWIWPPVEGWADGLIGALAALEPVLPAPLRPLVTSGAVAGVVPTLTVPAAPVAPVGLRLASAARRTTASLEASALRRKTTWMLPAAPPAPGTSRRATIERTRFSRAGFEARTISELLRDSA